MAKIQPHETWRELVEPKNVWLFIPGTISLAIIGNGFYDILAGTLMGGWSYITTETGWAQLTAIFVGLILFIVVVIILRIWLNLRRRFEVIPPHEHRAKPCEYVIMLVSIGPHGPEMRIVEHHRQRLRRCWLLASTQSEDRAKELATQLIQQGINPHIGLINDVNAVDETYHAVKDAVGQARQMLKGDERIIVDFTGSTKVASVGAVLACLHEQVAMEYLCSKRDDTGRPISGSEQAIEIHFRGEEVAQTERHILVEAR